MKRAVAHLFLLAALGFGVLSQNAPHVSAQPAATPPVGDTGPVDWGDPTADPRPHAPSLFGRVYPPATQAARDWAYHVLGSRQFACLDRIFHYESGWRVEAWGGIPQARPPQKMRSAGADWKTNPTTQVRWGLRYIGGRYGTPCEAWAFKARTGWY
jgi:hypothetical protein